MFVTLKDGSTECITADVIRSSEYTKLMEENGYKDSGQVKENIGTIMQPEHVWFGSYFKYEIEE